MIGDIIAVMREEGLVHGTTLADDLFPGQGGARWQAVVQQIYDTAEMERAFGDAFAQELSVAAPEEIAAMQAFFGSDQGQQILTLELEARRALLDDAVEDAAKLAVEDMVADRDPRMELLRRFATANDLIESNVMGALNSNFAFYRGMAEVGGFGDMTEADMLADVWSQEADIRSETEDWLFPYLALAYQPLDQGDLEAYLAFSETEAGQKLNAALFAAYDVVFSRISLDLGRAAARQMQGEDI